MKKNTKQQPIQMYIEGCTGNILLPVQYAELTEVVTEQEKRTIEVGKNIEKHNIK